MDTQNNWTPANYRHTRIHAGSKMWPIARGGDLTWRPKTWHSGTKPMFWHHHPPLFIVYTINQKRPSLACVHSAGPALAEQVFLNIHGPVYQLHRSKICSFHVSAFPLMVQHYWRLPVLCCVVLHTVALNKVLCEQMQGRITTCWPLDEDSKW